MSNAVRIMTFVVAMLGSWSVDACFEEGRHIDNKNKRNSLLIEEYRRDSGISVNLEGVPFT